MCPRSAAPGPLVLNPRALIAYVAVALCNITATRGTVCMLTMLAVATVALAGVAEPPPLTRIEDAYPALSPDGRVLLFQSNRSGRTALYSADPDGGNVRVFLDSGDDPVVAVWTPDSS